VFKVWRLRLARPPDTPHSRFTARRYTWPVSRSTSRVLVRVLFTAADGKRKTIYLGKTPKKAAEAIRIRIEHLLNAVSSRLPVDQETAPWVGGVGDDLHAKLAAAGLVPPRQSAKLGEFHKAYFERRKSDAKPATPTAMRTCRNDVIDFFGKNTDLRSVTEQWADDFRTHLLSRVPKQ